MNTYITTTSISGPGQTFTRLDIPASADTGAACIALVWCDRSRERTVSLTDVFAELPVRRGLAFLVACGEVNEPAVIAEIQRSVFNPHRVPWWMISWYRRSPAGDVGLIDILDWDQGAATPVVSPNSAPGRDETGIFEAADRRGFLTPKHVMGMISRALFEVDRATGRLDAFPARSEADGELVRVQEVSVPVPAPLPTNCEFLRLDLSCAHASGPVGAGVGLDRNCIALIWRNPKRRRGLVLLLDAGEPGRAIPAGECAEVLIDHIYRSCFAPLDIGWLDVAWTLRHAGGRVDTARLDLTAGEDWLPLIRLIPCGDGDVASVLRLAAERLFSSDTLSLAPGSALSCAIADATARMTAVSTTDSIHQRGTS